MGFLIYQTESNRKMDKAPQNAGECYKMCCVEPIVSLDRTLAIVLLVVNIFLPGIGTCISACLGDSFKCNTLIIGILQFFTSGLVLGWLWSIFHGVLLVKAAKK